MARAHAQKNTVSIVPTQNGQSRFGALIQSVAALTPQEKQLLKTTVAKNATDEELAWFLYLCKQYQVDPFLRQAFFIKYKDEPTMMISRDGLLSIAQRHPKFKGLKGAVVYEGDEFEIDTVNHVVVHKQRGKRGEILGAWAAAYREDRDPVIWFAPIDEYEQQRDIWKKYKSAMILKVAESYVLRKQFEIAGFAVEEELGVELSQPGDVVIDAETVPEQSKARASAKQTEDDREERLRRMQDIMAVAEAHGISRRELREIREMFTREPLPPLEVIDMIDAELHRRIEQRMAAQESEQDAQDLAQEVGLGIDEADVIE